jgi:hypothetical protein
MDCERIDAALAELLDGKKNALAEAHLASCAACRARFAELATTAAAVADLADAYRPPADADAALERALYERIRRRRAGVNPGWLAVAAVFGAAVAAVFVRAAPSPTAVSRFEAPGGRAPGPPAPFEAAPPASARPAPPAPVHARTTRFREAVQAAKEGQPIEPVLDAYAAEPDDADEALGLDETLGGYFDQELRPELLRGCLERAAAAIDASRWDDGCEAARTARRLDHGSAAAAGFLARCEAEAARIAAQANAIPDESARRTMLRGALQVATPGSQAYRAIEGALTGSAPPPEPPRPAPR